MKKILLFCAIIFQFTCSIFFPASIQAKSNLIFSLDSRTWKPSSWDSSETDNKENVTYEMLAMPQLNDDDNAFYETPIHEPEETIFVQKLPHTKESLGSLIETSSEIKKYSSSNTIDFNYEILKESKNRLLVNWTSKDSLGTSRKGITYFLRDSSQIFSLHYATTIMDWDENHLTTWAKILKKARIAKNSNPNSSSKSSILNRFIYSNKGIQKLS